VNAARERPWLQQYGHAPAAIEVPQATLLEQFLGHAVARPEDPCVVYLDTVVTYVTMIGLAERVAAHLDDLGVRAGERIAIQFDNSPAFVASLLGVWMRRATAVLLNPLYRRNELQHIIEDSRPKGILCSVETRDALHELGSVAAGPGFVSVVDDRALLDDPLAWSGAMLPVDDVGSSTTLVLDQSLPGEIILNADRWPVPGNAAADVAALIYTSGTTGPPKGAMLSHGNLAFTSAIHVPWLEMSASDRVLCVAPLAHVTGLVQGFGLSATGGVPILLTHRFDPAVIATVVRQQQATVTISSPAGLPSARSSSSASGTGSASTSTTSTVSQRPRRHATPCRSVPQPRLIGSWALCRSACRCRTLTRGFWVKTAAPWGRTRSVNSR
jgi:long-chain acyl-CoA synthetase